MLVKVKVEADGPGPSEKLVTLEVGSGANEALIISEKILLGSAIDVGNALATRDNQVLVELPRETTSGHWRVWISKDQTISRTPVPAE